MTNSITNNGPNLTAHQAEMLMEWASAFPQVPPSPSTPYELSIPPTPWAKSPSAVKHKKEALDMRKITKNVFLLYNDFSRGGRALAKELGFSAPKRDQILYGFPQLTEGDYTVINWGSFQAPSVSSAVKMKLVNKVQSVLLCADKWKFFSAVQGRARTPEVTDKLSVALDWAKEGETVMGRSFRGSCGKDIVFYGDSTSGFAQSNFWAKYKKKKDEFRIHLAFGKVISVQKKALRTTDLEGKPIDTANVDFRIRNLAHGFIFKRHDIEVPADVIDQAKAAFDTTGLDFGAVDVIWNGAEKKAYVLEINTAPGLEGTTLLDYAKAFKEFFESENNP